MSLPFDSPTLRKLINTTLEPIGLWSANAEELLLATCANESSFGVFRAQMNGPALGVFQMEPEDHDDAWKNYIQYHQNLVDWLKTLSKTCTSDELENNDPYAIAMTRVHYLRCPGTLPDPTDLEAIWQYYKHFYNTLEGSAIESKFKELYLRYVTDAKAS